MSDTGDPKPPVERSHAARGPGHPRGAPPVAASLQQRQTVPRPGHPRSERHAESPIQWSVVIPAFNEARRLPPYLEEVVGCFEGRGEPWECVVVDDSSTDRTADTVRAVTARCPAVRALVLGPRNLGKGGAVRTGMLSARGRFRLFTDADGATPIAELKRLEPAFAAGADVVIGSRAPADPAGAGRPRPHPPLAGRGFNRVLAGRGGPR